MTSVECPCDGHRCSREACIKQPETPQCHLAAGKCIDVINALSLLEEELGIETSESSPLYNLMRETTRIAAETLGIKPQAFRKYLRTTYEMDELLGGINFNDSDA